MDDFIAVWNMFNCHIESLSNNQIEVVKFKSHRIHQFLLNSPLTHLIALTYTKHIILYYQVIIIS